MSTATQRFTTTGELADALRSQSWKIRQLLNDGEVAEERVGRSRLIPVESLPTVLAAFERRGWLSGAKLEAVKADLIELGWLAAEQEAEVGDEEYAENTEG